MHFKWHLICWYLIYIPHLLDLLLLSVFLVYMFSLESCLTLLRPHGLLLTRLLSALGSPCTNTGLDCHFLLQAIFLDQGSNPCLLHWQVNSLPMSPALAGEFFTTFDYSVKTLVITQLFPVLKDRQAASHSAKKPHFWWWYWDPQSIEPWVSPWSHWGPPWLSYSV